MQAKKLWLRLIHPKMGLVFASKGLPCGLRIAFTDSFQAELCSNWERADGNGFCSWEVSWLCLWPASKDYDRSQATRIAGQNLNQVFPRLGQMLPKLQRYSLDISFSCRSLLLMCLSHWVHGYSFGCHLLSYSPCTCLYHSLLIQFVCQLITLIVAIHNVSILTKTILCLFVCESLLCCSWAHLSPVFHLFFTD